MGIRVGSVRLIRLEFAAIVLSVGSKMRRYAMTCRQFHLVLLFAALGGCDAIFEDRLKVGGDCQLIKHFIFNQRERSDIGFKF